VAHDPGAPPSLRTRIGLTSRGWVFLGAGVVLAVLGLARGWTPVVQFGALVAVLPLAAAALTRNPASDLVLDRTLSSRELASGEHLKVTVSVRGRFPRGRSLLLEDAAPPELGGPHRFALNGISGQGVSGSQYQLRVAARGIHHLGPMRIHVVDRFGMVHRVITTGGREEIIVHPPVAELEPMVLGGASVGTGSGHLGARGAATDDVIPRDYHPGDEVRRIDWKASARTGALMVRSEENPWRSAVTLVVDLRESSHRGAEPESSVDAALSMAASIGCLALESGWDLTVRTTDDVSLFIGSPMTGLSAERRELLLALATVPVSHSTVPSSSLAYSAQSAGSGPLVLIAGRVEVPTARLLTTIGANSPTRLLVAIATDQWSAPRDGMGSSASLGSSGEDALAWFHQSGWRITRLQRPGPGADGLTRAVAASWAGLGALR
jgi:uncharacterized protein (DUF58 family)